MDKKNNLIITRFAPSPSGKFHAGSYRTAIFNYLFAKKMNGKFILRIEDTDKARNKQEYIDDILENFSWLNIIPDKFEDENTKANNINYKIDEKTNISYILQSERVERHKYILEKMIEMNFAFISNEPAKDNSGEMREVIRFKNPNKKVSWNDEIRGKIEFDTTDLGDFVIARNINDPLFHLAVVVDDFDIGITHIIRGEDHIANTPRQILIKEAIEKITNIKKDFIYAHLPMVLGKDKLKLSKRRGAKSITEYKESGYLKDAIFNFVSFIGFHPGNGEEREIFSIDEIIKIFDLKKIHKSGAILNEEKLNWYNKEYIKRQSREEQINYIKKYLPNSEILEKENILEKIIEILVERINYYGELKIMSEIGEFDYFLTNPVFDEKNKIENVIWKNSTKEKTISNLLIIKNILEQNIKSNIQLNKDNFENIWNQIYVLAEKEGKGDVLWPLRYSLSGREKSIDPKNLLFALGLEKSLKRIDNVLNLL